MSDYVWISEDDGGYVLAWGQKYRMIKYFTRDADYAPTFVQRFNVNERLAEPVDVTASVLAEIHSNI